MFPVWIKVTVTIVIIYILIAAIIFWPDPFCDDSLADKFILFLGFLIVPALAVLFFLFIVS